ncbi:DUF2811 domain-containing protein [Gloeothece verrucosa]|uniref:Uncharacterized protein n=1 Tax=Gloeothece verrucosa (strain PCC 7822) TaxID=497965 RepID=E0U8I4_GLOV7|nr:DUF2811 domain-containing protein [Gloeothece verrucosa]ADN13730.1 conserved hypothetical protein [Gloeothece verrucosa PCC 7822]
METYQISLVTEIPAPLHQSLQNYLNSHPDSDQDKVFTEALSLFFKEQNKLQEKSKIIMI